MNQLNTLHGNEPTDQPIYWNIQTIAENLRSWTSTSSTSPVFWAIMSILNHHVVDNGYVQVYPSEYPCLF